MSGGEPSSIKRSTRCAARAPALSRRCVVRVGATFEFEVHGLVSQPGGILLKSKRKDVLKVHQALYRKWRPASFDEVVGQEHITSVLKYEIENRTFSHAYLFCGSRGTGKTTCAKILAKAVNCESPINGSPCGKCPSCLSIDMGTTTDVLEMDAASNNGVDNIRDIRDEVVYTPSQLKFRVYIVDEVHMLSGSAFNALLKTLEEPPEHVIFILATTELQKLPATIISRCQRFDFRRISVPVLSERLKKIADAEGFTAHPDAIRLIAKLAQGGMRDAISLLDLCSGNGNAITLESVEESAGITGRGAMIETIRALADKNYEFLFDTVAEVLASSKDLAVFWQDLISVYRDMLVIKTTSDAKRYLDLTDEELASLSPLAARFTKETILSHCRILDTSLYAMQKIGASKRITAEMALIRLCDESLDQSNDAILSRLSQLEDKVKLASFSSQTVSEPAAAAQAAPVPHLVADDEPKKKETPTEAPKAARTPSREVSIDDKKKLKALRCKMEIAEKLAMTDIPSASFLKSSGIFETGDKKIIVKTTNDFAITMLSRQKTKEALCLAISSCLGREISPTDVSIEASRPDDNEEYDVIDDLLDD